MCGADDQPHTHTSTYLYGRLVDVARLLFGSAASCLVFNLMVKASTFLRLGVFSTSCQMRAVSSVRAAKTLLRNHKIDHIRQSVYISKCLHACIFVPMLLWQCYAYNYGSCTRALCFVEARKTFGVLVPPSENMNRSILYVSSLYIVLYLYMEEWIAGVCVCRRRHVQQQWQQAHFRLIGYTCIDCPRRPHEVYSSRALCPKVGKEPDLRAWYGIMVRTNVAYNSRDIYWGAVRFQTVNYYYYCCTM